MGGLLKGAFTPRHAFLSAIAAYWFLFVLAMAVLPDTVPVHMGDPPRTGSKWEFAVVPVLATLVTLILVELARAFRGEKLSSGRDAGAFLDKCNVTVSVFLLIMEAALLVWMLTCDRGGSGTLQCALHGAS